MTNKELAAEYYCSAKMLEGRIEQLKLEMEKMDSSDLGHEELLCRRELLMAQRRDLLATARYLECYGGE